MQKRSLWYLISKFSHFHHFPKILTYFFTAFSFSRQTKHHDFLSLFALTGDNQLYGWGYNSEGNLGLGFASDEPPRPTRIPFPPTAKPVHLSTGEGHTVTLTKDGKIFAFGKNTHGQIGNGSTLDQVQVIEVKLTITLDARRQIRVSQIACGSYHSVALSDDGSVYTWGANDKGQLGEGSKIGQNPTPKRIQMEDKVIKISCGKHHTLALTEHGEIYTWGSNHHGQLGIGSTSKSRAPVRIEIETRVTDILAHGSISSCRLAGTPGVIAMWGKLPEITGKAVDYPWETLLGGMEDVFSSWDTDPGTPRGLRGEVGGGGGEDANLMRWTGLKCVDYGTMPALKLAFVYGSGFEQSAVLISREEDDVYFVGRSVHGSLGSGASTEFETRVPIKNINLSGKGIFCEWEERFMGKFLAKFSYANFLC